ncbi:MAG: helix-turn-helix domain-containing protein [Bacteroidota bacterium]
MKRAFIPSDRLKPYVSVIEIHENEAEQTYKVLPGTGLVMGFQFSGGISKIEESAQQGLAGAGITGIANTYSIFKSAAGTGSVLVYFREGGAAPFFSTPLHEIFSESVSLDNFMLRSELLVIEEQLHEAPTDQKRVAVVEKFLLSRLKALEVDKLVVNAVAIIYKNNGVIRIGELASQLNISQAPLEKRFRKTIGASPKKFATIVRMKHAISSYRSGESLTELGYRAGFYDQAHFIKEFRAFTGDNPKRFFGEETGGTA